MWPMEVFGAVPTKNAIRDGAIVGVVFSGRKPRPEHPNIYPNIKRIGPIPDRDHVNAQ